MWEALYEKHHNELARYCYGICRSLEEAQDMVQETFLRALQSGEVFLDLGPQQQRAWLYRTARNLMVDRFRRASLEARTLPSLQEPESQEEAGYSSVESRSLLERLSPEDRALFTLRYEEGYTAAELAELFGQPPGTVRCQLSRIRSQLRRGLEK